MRQLNDYLTRITLTGISLLFLCSSMYAQRTISGMITDAVTDDPLIGATIQIVGTSTGVVTDLEGNFTLQLAPEQNQLRFTYTGYAEQLVEVGTQTVFDIEMTSGQQLEEVVVVGYGTQKKASITGSVASVQSDEVTVVPSTNISQSIQGRLPGLIVKQGQGRPGADGANISIRGFGANLGGPQGESPLVIVDGFQRDFSQLDPNEIETITVLKDAAAAVYGVRAGAGVILVTTKKGRVGKPVLSVNSTFSLTDFTSFPKLATYQGYLQALNQNPTGDNDGIVNNITSERLAALEAGDPGTDWLDVIANDFAPQMQHNLNVRGGSDNIRYFTSVGYLNQGTIWKSGEFGYERYNGSMNLDFDINQNLTAGVILGWRRELRSSSRSFEGVDLYTIAFSNPAYPATLPDPSRVSGANVDNPRNPYSATRRDIAGYDDNRRDNLNGALSLTYQVPGVNGLKLNTKAGYLQTYTLTSTLTRPYSLWYLTDAGYREQQARSEVQLGEASQTFERLTTNVSATYERDFGRHGISTLLLYETLGEQFRNIAANGNDLLSAETPFLFANNPDFTTVGGGGSEYGRAGVIGRVNYNYGGRYLLEMSFRRDKSSYFPTDSRTGFFPGVSAGWVISKENFVNNTGLLSFLKLRASYSRLGNDGASNYDYIGGFRQLRGENGYVLDGRFQSVIQTLGVPNPRITWQLSDLYNVGLDINLLDYRLGLVVDAFYRKRSQLLATSEGTVIVNTTGAETPLENIESADNRGFEVALNYRGGQGDFKYQFSANGSWAREKYLDQVEPDEFATPDRERINRLSGNFVNRTFGYVFDGFYTQGELDNLELVYFANQQDNLKPGDIKVRDTNGDGIIDQDDRVLIGRNNTPEILYGFNTNLTYKNFSFTMFWQGASNFNFNISGQERGLNVLNSGTATPYQYIIDNLWTAENMGNGAEFPVDLTGPTNNLTLDKYYLDASYVRLKNLVFGYSIPKRIATKFGFRNINVAISGTNLVTFDKLGFYPWDPETPGVGAYPAQRIFTLDFDLSF